MADEDEGVGAPVAGPSIVLLTLARRIESELSRALSGLGLTVSRFGLLGHIAGVPGASFSDLARMSGISVQSTHAAVKSLAASGMVRDNTGRAGSASAIELTEEGHRVMRQAMELVSDVDDRLFGEAADPVQQEIGGAVYKAFGPGI